MKIFISKYINKIDVKGRVSIPAGYRSVLAQEHCSGIVVYPSFKNPCIEACSFRTLEEKAQMIQNLEPYSAERDAFETLILGESVQLQFDNEGRVTLPGHLLAQVGISDQACFVGKGNVFEIWDTENFNNYLKAAKEIAQNNRMILKNIDNNIAGV